MGMDNHISFQETTMRSHLNRSSLQSLAFETAAYHLHSNPNPAHPWHWFSDNPNETVEAQRRRRGQGKPTGRAEMPTRPSSTGEDRGDTPTGGGGGGGMLPTGSGGQPKLPVWLIIVLIVAYLAYTVFFSGDQQPLDQQPQVTEPVLVTQGPTFPPPPTNTPGPTAKPVTPLPPSGRTGKDQTWTIMLYADADDQVLEQDIMIDLNEAEKVGSSAQINIVAQVDRFAGGFSGDGNWTSTRRYYITKDNDLSNLNSKMVSDLGEVSMGNPQTLIDFATWAIKTYPADKYVLILSDHGMGWPGGWTDPAPSALRSVSIPFSSVVNQNMLYTTDIDQSLAAIRQQTGVDKFELLGMDACLMSHLEVYSALAPHARYVVNSQETEPALGWAYNSFLTSLTANPGMDGAELGRAIVSSFIEKDERILDQQARLEFLSQGSPMASLFGRIQDMDPRQLSQQIGRSITLTTAKMDALPGLMEAVNNLAFAMQKEDQSVVARARTYAQSFTSIFGKSVPPSYIDLGNFAALLQRESSNSSVKTAAAAVVDQLKKVVVAEKHGSEKPGATGISIYFPNSQLYQNAAAGMKSYTRAADRFVKDSLWDDFLAFHYTNASFKVDTRAGVEPAAGSRVASPASAAFEVSPLKISATSVNYNQPVTLEADLTGKNIGYVYLFVGYYDAASKSIFVADKDYLEASKTQQIGDLYYPDWSSGSSFKLKFNWMPTVFSISDGKKTTVALFTPERYGASAKEAVYTVDGNYKPASGGQSRYARLYFSDGQMRRMFAYSGQEATGALREVIPQTGDQITLIQTWLTPDAKGVYQPGYENGETLTFGSTMFTWKEQYAAAGNYAIGFVVSDLDGSEKTVLGAVKIK